MTNEEIELDIRETQTEIDHLNRVNDRLKLPQINDRHELIRDLEKILRDRKVIERFVSMCDESLSPEYHEYLTDKIIPRIKHARKSLHYPESKVVWSEAKEEK